MEKIEKRKYIRLDTVFPIEFQLVSKEDRRPLSELYEGFTRNVGRGGMGIFAKTLKQKDEEFFNFVPRETKLKVIINIPLDKEPIESLATVEWIEKQPGPIVDTYLFGISYDFINEVEYEKIISYVKWLHLRPKVISAIIVLLVIAFVLSSVFLFKINKRRIESERGLVKTVAESRRARKAKIQAEEKKSLMKTELEAGERERVAMRVAFAKLAEKKKTLEEMSRLSEEEREDLQLQIEELAEEKMLLEEEIERETAESGEEAGIEKEISEREEGVTEISEKRLKSEEPNYNRFRELVLNEKIQSLSAYTSTHRSSIYHAAALFALAELRYKHKGRALAEVSYNQVIELYSRSKYALYSSHRLGQLGIMASYEYYTLKDFYDTYNLPKLLDYRNIEPYIR